jgi:regulator of ribonuclease activity A
VQALGCHPLKTEKKGAGQLNVALRFGGVDFIPGEYLYADNNGLLVSEKELTID